MSKLSVVKGSLEARTDLIIASIRTQQFYPTTCGWSQTVDIWVAPVQGIYKAAGLQEFMMGLVPEGIEASCMDQFREWQDELEFGKLYFDEEIGYEDITRRCTITEEWLPMPEGFVDGYKEIESRIPYRRRTWVRVFPDAQIATDILSGALKTEYRIKNCDLRRYQPGFLERVLRKR